MRFRTAAVVAVTVVVSTGLGAALAVIERPPAADVAAPATCSAAGLEEPAPQAGLLEGVERTRELILGAALACDYDSLEALAMTRGRFTYDFGEPDTREAGATPARYWKQTEEVGEPVLARLVEVLRLPYAQIEVDIPTGQRDTIYVWPSAASGDTTPGDWSAVGRLYEPHEIAAMRAGDGYSGLRVGIDFYGDWLFFFEGD